MIEIISIFPLSIKRCWMFLNRLNEMIEYFSPTWYFQLDESRKMVLLNSLVVLETIEFQYIR